MEECYHVSPWSFQKYSGKGAIAVIRKITEGKTVNRDLCSKACVVYSSQKKWRGFFHYPLKQGSPEAERNTEIPPFSVLSIVWTETNEGGLKNEY